MRTYLVAETDGRHTCEQIGPFVQWSIDRKRHGRLFKFHHDQHNDIRDDHHSARTRVFEQVETFGKAEGQNEQYGTCTGGQHRMQVPDRRKIRSKIGCKHWQKKIEK